MCVFGCQSVINADNLQPGSGADFGADIIMAVQPAQDEATAMQIDNRWFCAGVAAARNASDGLITRGDAKGIAPVE